MKATVPPLVKAPLYFVPLCLFVCPLTGLSLGIRIPEQDAAAAARGNAFVATADNPSAVYYNPAGISQLEGQNISAGAYGILMGSHFDNGRVSLDSQNDAQAVPQFFYAGKLPGVPISLGLGLYSPYGLSQEWPDAAPFSALSTRGEIDYFTLNPVVSWQALPSLSVAAGPTFNYAETDLRNKPLGNPANNFRFRGRDTDIGFNAGIFWKPLEQHAFGVTYRSETKMNFDGHSDLEIPSFGVNQSGVSSTAEFQFPQTVVFGYSFRPTPNWNLEFDADWTDWDSLDTVVLKPRNEQLVFDWQSSWMYEFGVTRYFDQGWKVSGGYIFSENSVPDATFSPGTPDSDRHIFCVGVGKKFEKLTLDLAYQLSWGPTRTLSNPAGSPNASANGNYDYLGHAITLNVGYHF